MAAVSKQQPTGHVPTEDVDRKIRSSKLEDQAATAALYVTRNDRHKTGQEFLDKDHKISSAGAAASLKYANPQDLPSYPTSGLKKNDSAAGAAASLGWANQKPFEHWKPDPSSSASAAAMHAKDYKMAPLWQPEQSANGAKAALLAHRDGGKVDIWQPEDNSLWGSSAAAQAFKKFGAGGLSPVLDYGYTNIGRQGSLLAATGAMSNGRRRAQSMQMPPPVKPDTYPDESNATSNALRAATSAAKQGRRTNNSTEPAGTSPYTNMSREMYTSHPPVAPEVEEKNRADTLRASAVAMAQGMYQQQQAQFATAAEAASHAQSGRNAQSGAIAAHGRKPSTSSFSTGDEVAPMRFNSLQEAAHKLAQERLAKLHDEHAKNREYRDYYGGKDTPKATPPNTKAHNRLSIRGRARRRASSDSDLDVDREQSNKIRAQMSIFSSNVAQVDEKKRTKDRENLIAAAQRNVTKSLHGMDERVFADTGKVTPSLLSEWEVKAHAAAQKNSDARMENHGMIHIGGGKFVSQSEIDGVAARNVQPVLDEINEKAATERERQAAVKLEQETAARKEAEKKARARESKQIDKKLKQQDKDEEKMRKSDEKAARKEEERLSKEKRKSTPAAAPKTESPDVAPTSTETETEPAVATSAIAAPVSEEASTTPVATTPVATTPAATTPATESREADTRSVLAPIRTSMEDQASLRMRETADAANRDESTPMSPASPGSGKVKNWLKSKFSHRSSKSLSKTSKSSPDKEKANEGGFVGGAALTGASANNSTASLGPQSSSIRDVALARPASPAMLTKTNTVTPDPITDPEPASDASEVEEERLGRLKHRASDVSSLSNRQETDDDFQEARDNFDEDLIPPPTFPAEKSSSPVRDSKFKEVI